MEHDAVKCARFILSLHNDGYYVDDDTLFAAKNDCTDGVNDSDMMDDDYDDVYNG